MSLEAINAERRARMTLERRLGELESRVRGMWVFPATVSDDPDIYRLRMAKGNIIATIASTNFYGVKVSPSVITSIPIAVPSVSGSYADGLAAAYLVTSSLEATSPSIVWVLHGSYTDAFGASGLREANGSIPEGYVVLSRKKVVMNCAAGGTVTAYVPWR